MSIIVLPQASPESFLVIINDINLEATVTNRAETACAWISHTNPSNDRRLIVGISTTASPSPSFSSSSGVSASLHLCCGNRCLVFSLLRGDKGIPSALADFLFDRKRVMLVGTRVRRGGDWLGRGGPMLVCRDPRELGEARGWRGVGRLDRIAGELVGREKAIRVRGWDGRPLWESQVAAACLEVYLLAGIGERMVGIHREGFASWCMCAV